MRSAAAGTGESTGSIRKTAATGCSVGGLTTVPVEILLAIAFTGFLTLCAVFVELPAARQHGLALLCAFVAAVCWWASPAAAVAVGALGWPFYVAWVVRSDGDLLPRDWRSLLALALLAGVGLTAAWSRRVATWPARRRAASSVAAVEAADARALFYPTMPPARAASPDEANRAEDARPR
jgi:hypothetical protein